MLVLDTIFEIYALHGDFDANKCCMPPFDGEFQFDQIVTGL